MGGKGGEASNVMQQQYESAPTPGTGGYIYPETGTTEPPKREPVKKEETKAPPITEDPSKAGAETIQADAEIHPYAPPGFGNYPSTNTNLSPLGDALVQGMQDKANPAASPLYTGQV